MEDAIRGYIAFWIDGKVVDYGFGSGMTQVGAGRSIIAEMEVLEDRLELRAHLVTESAVTLKGFTVTLRQAVAPEDRVLINGYQSWTESRQFRPDEYIPRLQAPMARLVNTTGDYTFYNNPAKAGELHSWSFTTLFLAKTDRTRAWLDLNPEEGYSIFEWRCGLGELVIRGDVGGRVANGKTNLLHIGIWENPGTEVGGMPTAHARPVKAPATGWTSWYNYYTKITEDIILDNLRAFAFRELPIDYFQIDDGWQPAVGDWTEANEKFPQGMAFLADQIHRYGYRAGLWLAPLIVERDSKVYQLHRDWLVTHDGERLLEAGYNPGWGGLIHGTYYLLDLEKAEVRDHLKVVFNTVLLRWGYDLVKLDFLFAAALIPRNGKSRGQLMYEACAFLRECCGDKLILGCGVPLAPAWNVFDYCRIGPDIGLNWEMHSAKLIRLRERISTHNALHNAINRRQFKQFFANDPDVFILRRHNQELSPHQQRSLFLINHIFGDLLFTSDDIGSYDAERMRLYRSAFPVRQVRVTRVEQDGELYRIWFGIGGEEGPLARRYFVGANLSRDDKQIALPDGEWYHPGEGFVQNPGATYFKRYETRVFVATPQNQLGITGSDLHMFPGCEVEELEQVGEEIRLSLHPHCKTSGTLVLTLGEKDGITTLNGQPVKPFQRNGAWLLSVTVQDGKIS
ncbi:MAG: glycoside hydrolase family 36 protein [Bacteroidia bacterium]